MDLLYHPWFTTTKLSYRFPILKLPPPPCAVLLVELNPFFLEAWSIIGMTSHFRHPSGAGQDQVLWWSREWFSYKQINNNDPSFPSPRGWLMGTHNSQELPHPNWEPALLLSAQLQHKPFRFAGHFPDCHPLVSIGTRMTWPGMIPIGRDPSLHISPTGGHYLGWPRSQRWNVRSFLGRIQTSWRRLNWLDNIVM